MKKNRYLIEVVNNTGGCMPNNFFIDGIVLEGDKKELERKLSRDLDFVSKLKISSTLLGEKYRLIPEDSVEFP